MGMPAIRTAQERENLAIERQRIADEREGIVPTEPRTGER